MRSGSPTGTVIAVIAEANFILHELTEILHRHGAIDRLAVSRGLFIFHQHRRRFLGGAGRRWRAYGLPSRARFISARLRIGDPDLISGFLFIFIFFKFGLRILKRLFQKLKALFNRQRCRHSMGGISDRCHNNNGRCNQISFKHKVPLYKMSAAEYREK